MKQQKKIGTKIRAFDNRGIAFIGDKNQMNIENFNEASNYKAPRLVNQYFIMARLLPAIVGLLPLLIMSLTILGKRKTPLLMIVICIGWLIFTFLGAKVFATASKYFENKYYSNRKLFPTTYFLLYSDSKFSDDYKSRFRKKIRENTGIEIPNKEQERVNLDNTINIIHEALAYVRIRVAAGNLVIHHNIIYGASRNFIVGSLVGGVISSVGVFFSLYCGVSIEFASHIISSIFLWSYFFSHKYFLQVSAESYAIQLINEYLNLKTLTND